MKSLLKFMWHNLSAFFCLIVALYILGLLFYFLKGVIEYDQTLGQNSYLLVGFIGGIIWTLVFRSVFNWLLTIISETKDDYLEWIKAEYKQITGKDFKGDL